jgi:hypothetical protein
VCVWVDTGRKAAASQIDLEVAPGMDNCVREGWMAVSVRPGNRRFIDMTGMQGHLRRPRRTRKNILIKVLSVADAEALNE